MNYYDGLEEVAKCIDGERFLLEKELEELKKILRDYGIEVK